MGFRQGKQASFSVGKFRVESSLYQQSTSIYIFVDRMELGRGGWREKLITRWEVAGDRGCICGTVFRVSGFRLMDVCMGHGHKTPSLPFLGQRCPGFKRLRKLRWTSQTRENSTVVLRIQKPSGKKIYIGSKEIVLNPSQKQALPFHVSFVSPLISAFEMTR